MKKSLQLCHKIQGKQDLCSSSNALWWILTNWTSRKSRYPMITENYELTELKNFSAIATNFTDFKTELVRRSKRKNYFKARFQIKRQLPRPFIHLILWGILLGRLTAKLFPKQVCIFQRPKKQNPVEKWCMHAGKLHYKEHLIMSVLENKYSALFAKNNPSSKHSVPTMTTQSSTREISFPPAQGKERVHTKHNLDEPVSTVTSESLLCNIFGSVNQLPLTWLSHCTLCQA